MKKIQKRHIYRFLEFFIVGFVMGVTEDLIVIGYATDAAITPKVILIAALVALPFAAFSELIVDWKRIEFMHKGVNSAKKTLKGSAKLFRK